MSPHCPNTVCNAGWSEDFLAESTTITFLLTEFKEAKEKVLLDMERARLPETQERARRYKDAKTLKDTVNAKIASIRDYMNALPQKNTHMENRKIYKKADSMFTSGTFTKWSGKYEGKELEYTEKLHAAREAYHATAKVYEQPYNQYKIQIEELRTKKYLDACKTVLEYGAIQKIQPQIQSSWTFVMKCPKESCAGFVGNDWVCGLCEMEICKDCREPNTKDHECNPDTKLSVSAMAREAKPCPKCAASISKIDGCDQMWCTQCHTAFSWHTGTVETRIHNPHYYEWMHRNGGMPATGGAGGDCIADRLVIPRIQRYYWKDSILMGECYSVLHCESEIRSTLQNQIDEEKARAILRVKRLVGEISENEWMIQLQKIDKIKKKNESILAVLNMYVQASTDILREVLNENANRISISQQVQDLRKYCNDELNKLSKRYNSIISCINGGENVVKIFTEK